MPGRSQKELDAEIRSVLLQHGDDGTSPRRTLFYFYGGNLMGLDVAATKAGYDAQPTAKADGVVLITTTAVDAASFSPHSDQMEKWARQFGCEYDNWECQLVKR